jgi:hypothetical protein
VDDTDGDPREFHRADVLEFNPDGSGLQRFRMEFAQLRRRSDPAGDGRPVVLDERARRNRQQLAA